MDAMEKTYIVVRDNGKVDGRKFDYVAILVCSDFELALHAMQEDDLLCNDNGFGYRGYLVFESSFAEGCRSADHECNGQVKGIPLACFAKGYGNELIDCVFNAICDGVGV